MTSTKQPSIGDVHNYRVVQPQDWTEDFKHENGNYANICVTCKAEFVGYKRRFVCRVCAKREPVLTTDEVS